jgi:isopentenyl-diphosphate delta-isomerase
MSAESIEATAAAAATAAEEPAVKKTGEVAIDESCAVDAVHGDATQVQLMKEMCILVDESDRAYGARTKLDCHLWRIIETENLLHRAFSVFLFDERGRLMLQKRAASKITFPGHWANTCCSHPLHYDDELAEEGQLGVRRAARRKLEHELGIPTRQVPLDAFTYVTRIYYKAASDEQWGEHEIDYILFLQVPVTTSPNPNEVADCRFFTKDEVRDLIETGAARGEPLSPWFRLIATSKLFDWWDKLGSLGDVQDHTSILRLT